MMFEIFGMVATGVSAVWWIIGDWRNVDPTNETQRDIANTLECTYISANGRIRNISERQAALVDAQEGDIMLRNKDKAIWVFEDGAWVYSPDKVYSNGTLYTGVSEPPKPKVEQKSEEIIHVHRSPGEDQVTLTRADGKKVQVNMAEFLHSDDPAQLIAEHLGENVAVEQTDKPHRVLLSDGTWHDLQWNGPYLTEEEYQKMLKDGLEIEDLPKVEQTEKPEVTPVPDSAFWRYGQEFVMVGCWHHKQSEDDSKFFTPVKLDDVRPVSVILPVRGERLSDFNTHFYAECLEHGEWTTMKSILPMTAIRANGENAIGSHGWVYVVKNGVETATCVYTQLDVNVH